MLHVLMTKYTMADKQKKILTDVFKNEMAAQGSHRIVKQYLFFTILSHHFKSTCSQRFAFHGVHL